MTNNSFFFKIKQPFYSICNRIFCNAVSHCFFPIIFPVFSILLIVSRIIVQFSPNFLFIREYVDLIVYVTLIFSIFGVLYQASRIDLIVVPPKTSLIQIDSYYCIRDLSKEKERNIEIYLSKEGFFKTILESYTISYPEIGELKMVQTSFISVQDASTRIARRYPLILNGVPNLINREILDFFGLICRFRIDNPRRLLRGTTYEIRIKIIYRVFGFKMNKVKILTINP